MQGENLSLNMIKCRWISRRFHPLLRMGYGRLPAPGGGAAQWRREPLAIQGLDLNGSLSRGRASGSGTKLTSKNGPNWIIVKGSAEPFPAPDVPSYVPVNSPVDRAGSPQGRFCSGVLSPAAVDNIYAPDPARVQFAALVRGQPLWLIRLQNELTAS
jgi:hypothetical protein